MQKAYIEAIAELAENDSKVVLLTADNGSDLDHWFKREFERQYLDIGIAECGMVGIAAGMASCGMIPFVQTGGTFLAYRALEFIRNDVCMQRQNVKFIATGSGLSISNLGPTHHAAEDIGMLRTLPGLTLLSPCSPREVGECVRAAYEIEGPVYIRVGMSGEKELLQEDIAWRWDTLMRIRDGDDAVIFATGSIMDEVLSAGSRLCEIDISTRIVNVHALKPVNAAEILSEIADIKHVITVEEHNIHSGLGGIVAEIMAESGLDAALTRIGLDDVFAKGYGDLDDIRANNGLDAEHIFNTVHALFK